MADENSVSQDAQLDPVEVPDTWYLIRGSNGKGSVSTTLLIVSFFLVSIAYVASLIKLPFLKDTFDVSACASYFIPICTLYFARRHTEANS